MKTFKGTRGKWKVTSKFREPSILNESGQIIFTHNKSCYDTKDNTHEYYSHNKMMSNVNLVASAPELLEALQGIIDAQFSKGTLQQLNTRISEARNVVEKLI